MKLLVVTQTLDRRDPVLGFFHTWIEGLAKRFDYVEVIALGVGEHSLPENVHVHSLGKEGAPRSKIAYAFAFLKLAWHLRAEYDLVLVHMNQEYVLVAGWLWKLLGKKIYLWRNHYAGSVLTDIAVSFCIKVFCTSKRSYTAKFAKTALMPVGVDTSVFTADQGIRTRHSILFLSRMSKSKRPEMLLDALAELSQANIAFTADFVGAPPPDDLTYYKRLIARGGGEPLAGKVNFYGAVNREGAKRAFNSHEIFVNVSPSGMFDKTMFEAAASGAFVLATSSDFVELSGPIHAAGDTAQTLAAALKRTLALSSEERQEALAAQSKAIVAHSLPTLIDRLVVEMS